MIGNACRQSPLEKVSVIAPIKDEEASIAALINALLNQTYRPAEIILTDGGSSDRTREIIRKLQDGSSIPILLIEATHAYPGRGRNLAIANARNEWIASIDAGIVPDSQWLSELVKTADQEPDAQIIYGQFEPVTDSYFTECAAVTYAPCSRNARFIASSLFQRSAWKSVGGFREDLRTGEDLVFFGDLEKAGVREGYSGGAVVYWSLRPSLSSTFRHFIASSRHSLRAGLAFTWHFRVSCFYLLMLGTCLAGFFWSRLLISIPLVLLLRAERRLFKWHRVKAPDLLVTRMLDPSRVLAVATINVVIDVAMFCGMFQWLMRDYLGTGFETTIRNRKAEVSIDLEP